MGIIRVFGISGISFFVAGGFGAPWVGGPRRGFRKYLKHDARPALRRCESGRLPRDRPDILFLASSGASRGSLHRGARCKGEKARLLARKKGSGEPQKMK